MADEFIIGGGFFSFGGLFWLIFGGLYKTNSFENQLGFPVSNAPNIGIPLKVGIFLADLFMMIMLIGPLMFWVVIPIVKWGIVKRRRSKKQAAGS